MKSRQDDDPRQHTAHERYRPDRAFCSRRAIPTPGPWPGALVVEFAGSPAASAALKKGFSMCRGLPASLPRSALTHNPGQQVLDLCAAPGGKSLTLAEAMQDKRPACQRRVCPHPRAALQRSFDRCGVTCAVAVENDATSTIPTGQI